MYSDRLDAPVAAGQWRMDVSISRPEGTKDSGGSIESSYLQLHIVASEQSRLVWENEIWQGVGDDLLVRDAPTRRFGVQVSLVSRPLDRADFRCRLPTAPYGFHWEAITGGLQISGRLFFELWSSAWGYHRGNE